MTVLVQFLNQVQRISAVFYQVPIVGWSQRKTGTYIDWRISDVFNQILIVFAAPTTATSQW
jgi:hypothetical protein